MNDFKKVVKGEQGAPEPRKLKVEVILEIVKVSLSDKSLLIRSFAGVPSHKLVKYM